MTDLPLMPKATAVWLVDNTTLSFQQIARFAGLHILEVEGIADGEVAQGMKGADPVLNGQLTRTEIERCEADPTASLKLAKRLSAAVPEPKKKGPRYTPVSKRQDRPNAIAWLVRYHPELPDSAIIKLVGTTKPTIQSVREKSHWNTPNIRPVDPVALGLCKQGELDEAVRKAGAKRAAQDGERVLSDEEKVRLMSTEQSLSQTETRLPSSMSGLENFTLTGGQGGEEEGAREIADRQRDMNPDSLFNLPPVTEGEDEEDDDDLDPRS